MYLLLKCILLFFLVKLSLFGSLCLGRVEGISHLPPKEPRNMISDLEMKELDRKKTNFVRIDSGSFTMGSPTHEYRRNQDEESHQVVISKPFWMSKFELTNREWNQEFDEDFKKGDPIFSLSDNQLDEVSGTIGRVGGVYAVLQYWEKEAEKIEFHQVFKQNGNWELAKSGRTYPFKNPKLAAFDDLIEKLDQIHCKRAGRLDESMPVTRVSYSQAVSYCWALTTKWRKEKIIPQPLVVRLPTEAEWEYACRAGNSGFCGLGEGNWLTGENANIDGSKKNYILDERPGRNLFVPLNRGSVSAINQESPKYPANAWGIYDMHGNVMEWCYDYYGPYPKYDKAVNPIGPVMGTARVVRGGSFYRTAQESRSASRAAYEDSYRGSEIGIRLVIGYPLR